METKNTFLHVDKQHPSFGKVLFCSTYTLLFLQKLCSAENTIKSVFSAEHSSCVSQVVKTLSEDPSQNTTFQTKSAILGFPLPAETPIFGSLVIYKVTQKVTFSQTDKSTKMFFANLKQIVFCYSPPPNKF